MSTRKAAGRSLRRGPGRPGGAGTDRRERLLDAAALRFTRDGIAATTLRGIAQQARVTPALVHYYFGDKDGVLDALVAERLMPILDAIRDASVGSGNDVAALTGGFVRALTASVQQHPWLPALWVREFLSEGGLLRERLIARLAASVPQLLARRFATAQRAGELNPRLDPRLLVVSLIGLTMFPLAAAPIWRRIFDADDLDFGALQRHTIALLESGLQPSSKRTQR